MKGSANRTTSVIDGALTNMENGAASESADPSSFLTEIIGAPVVVKLNSSVVYKGLLQNVDGY